MDPLGGHEGAVGAWDVVPSPRIPAFGPDAPERSGRAARGARDEEAVLREAGERALKGVVYVLRNALGLVED